MRGVAIGGRGARVADLACQEAPDEASEEWSHSVRLVLQKVHDSSHAHAEESHLSIFNIWEQLAVDQYIP